MSESRVLLSSVITPIGARHGDGAAVGYELLHAQVTRAQGIFSPRAIHRQYGLDYIAANLDTPTTTLHYPSEKDFVRELREGGYTHVGIAFNLSTSHRMRRMSVLVRRYAPRATIVLGGYGTALPDEDLREHGDAFCRGEGVAFMRDLLGEPPLEGTFRHPLSISTMRVLGAPFSNTGLIFGGLGCPNGCDFCTTSHFFKRKHIPLLPTGQDIFDVIQAYRRIDPEMQFTVLDEDFLLNKRRAMELRELVQAEGLALDMFVFASVKALSMYTMQELVEIGVGGVWIGYEGTRSGYAKQVGRPVGELFADLKRHGVLVLASMIVGLDYQTPEIIREELDGLLKLEPTLAQFLIYGPMPGTPLGERTEREERWLPKYRDDRKLRWRHSDGFRALTSHPTMAPGEIEALQEFCFQEDLRRLGPAILRSLDVWQRGIEELRDSPIPAFARRSRRLEKQVRRADAIIPMAWVLARSPEVRSFLTGLSRRIRAGQPLGRRLSNRLLSVAAFPAGVLCKVGLVLDVGQDPEVTRYDWATEEHPAVAVLAERELAVAV